jgi:hypothetical protein
MQAKVTQEFAGRPDGEALSRTIKVDEVISGDLAAVAIREKWAVPELDDPNVAHDGESALDGMTTSQLKAFAAENGIDIGDATKKADIRAAIDLSLEGAE